MCVENTEMDYTLTEEKSEILKIENFKGCSLRVHVALDIG